MLMRLSEQNKRVPYQNLSSISHLHISPQGECPPACVDDHVIVPREDPLQNGHESGYPASLIGGGGDTTV